MASYDFHCAACDHSFTRVLPMRDLGRVKVACPSCGSPKVERVFAAFYAKTIRKS
ncbi:MAG TPA: zinc ribbon domain-containing protein [Gemmatimonadales bacterium]|nr:zinc ribbon domain-containing protein [Gemmatimonadales bacterium]